MRQFWPYPYVSHLLLLPPETAELRFDLLCFGLVGDGGRRGPSGLPVLAVHSGRLELGPARPVKQHRGYRPARRLRGSLHPARWPAPRITVVLELLPWSATRSELALIAGPTWCPAGAPGVRRYLGVAHDVLDALVAALDTPGAERDRRPGFPEAVLHSRGGEPLW